MADMEKAGAGATATDLQDSSAGEAKRPDNPKQSRRQAFAAEIERDLLATKGAKREYPRCFQCDRSYGKSAAPNERFCSPICVEAFDAGVPRYAELPNLAAFDPTGVRIVAGPPVPPCAACGDPAIEEFRRAGKVYCGRRCRDGQPKGCRTCGKSLWAIPRRGPYCSDACAQAKKGREVPDSPTPKIDARNPHEIRVSEGHFSTPYNVVGGGRQLPGAVPPDPATLRAIIDAEIGGGK